MAAINPNAKALKSATTNVDVAAATAPSSGQVLTATSSTTATWQTPSGGSDLSVFVPAGQGYISGTGVTLNSTTGSGQHITCVAMTDASNNQVWQVSSRVPSVANGLSISSVKLLFMNRAASVLNINGYFEVKKIPFTSGSSVTQDNTGTVTTFASPGTAGQAGVITAPADSFDGIGAVATNDIIGVYWNRQGNDAADTYGQTLEIVGLLITYA